MRKTTLVGNLGRSAPDADRLGMPAANHSQYSSVARIEPAITPFAFDSANIRVIAIDGTPWFVGRDVAEALGYKDHNTAMRDHCKGVRKSHPLPTAGGTQDTRILAESDVLRLIVGSTLPAAERFERWVFEDVLPAIRRTGAYTAASAQPSVPALPGTYIEALEHLLVAKKAEQAAIEERDEAVRTKAMIGSRREAQAMATASAAAREIKKIKAKLGEGAEHATVVAVIRAFRLDVNENSVWVPLRKWCTAHNVKPREVPDGRWGTVKSWPAAAWQAVYGIKLAEKFGEEGV